VFVARLVHYQHHRVLALYRGHSMRVEVQLIRRVEYGQSTTLSLLFGHTALCTAAHCGELDVIMAVQPFCADRTALSGMLAAPLFRDFDMRGVVRMA